MYSRSQTLRCQSITCQNSFSVILLSQHIGMQETITALLRSLRRASRALGPQEGEESGFGSVQRARRLTIGELFKVRKTPSWPRSWANFSPLQL